ncbi:hypothetical protein WAB17_03115 [Parerythrobacter aurantius]|uniref:hypothetical protein n=1 Tax=Parerythrobacter aurantius TaxID=3127706 RepID=UPI003243431B
MIALLLQYEGTILNVASVALFVAALLAGGGPERACAGTLLGMVVMDRTYHAFFGPSDTFAVIDPWHLLLDTAALVCFVTVSLQANRFYPMVLAAAQLVAFTAHIVRMLAEPVTSLSYYLLFTIPFWFQLLVVAGGIARHLRRTRRLGPYRDWRTPPGRGSRSSFV